ncbi:sulfotransferase domain-containing protein, partial [Alphaproteobacteria bacterium]|nr:sulfotransferase domain-containing protein [Alphaproteobacteria bacterium]
LSDLKIISKYWLKMQSKKNLGLKDGEFCFLKTHSAQLMYFDNYFTDIKKTLGFIYIIRDPRDVAISYSNHSTNSLDETISHMVNNTASIDYDQNTPEQKIKPNALLSRWDVHVKSWALFQVPNLTLRYEDLIKKKKEIIFKIIDFFEKNYNFKFHNIDHKIENIIKSTEFKTLKKNEEKYGFDEAIKNQPFFNVGKSQQWKAQLNLTQKNLIENKFKEEMIKFKYLSKYKNI